MESLQTRLKRATTAAHSRLETTPFTLALRAGQLPRESAVTYLTCLSIVHAAIERSLAQSSHPQNQEIYSHTSPKLPLLLADLALIAGEKVKTVGPAVAQAIALADKVIIAHQNDVGLIGYLYVLEGSQNGGVVLRDLVAHSLGVPADRISYFGCYGGRTRYIWSNFVNKLNSLSLNDKEFQIIEGSATLAFTDLEKIQLSLLPFSEQSLRHNVTSINPEAGSHEIPDDPLQIDVALRAGALPISLP